MLLKYRARETEKRETNAGWGRMILRTAKWKMRGMMAERGGRKKVRGERVMIRDIKWARGREYKGWKARKKNKGVRVMRGETERERGGVNKKRGGCACCGNTVWSIRCGERLVRWLCVCVCRLWLSCLLACLPALTFLRAPMILGHQRLRWQPGL